MGLRINVSISQLCIVLGSMLFFVCGHAQDSPADYVNALNLARSQVGVSNIVWNNKLAAIAQNFVNQHKGDCKVDYTSGGGRYRQNIAWSGGEMSGIEAVKLWVDEKPNYDFNSNSCVGGSHCSHYTHVISPDSTDVGCAKVQCDNNGGILISCTFPPPCCFPGGI